MKLSDISIVRSSSVKVIVVPGHSRSSKTSIWNEIHAKLIQNVILRVCLGGDSLDEIHPEERDAEIFSNNLSSMWQNFSRLRGRTMRLIDETGLVLEGEAICKTLREVSRARRGQSMHEVMTTIVLYGSVKTNGARLRKSRDRSHLQ